MKPGWEKPWGVFNPDLYGQQVVKTASNVCFTVFVVSVLLFTVIAVTYKPPDPWLQSTRSLAKLLTAQNATYQPDNSVVITAEDSPFSSPVSLPEAINQSFVDEEVALARLNSSKDCNDQSPVNCSAPGVLFAIEKFNLQLFRSLEFYSYRTPVRGSSDHECDAAWTYRSSKDGSPRMFRDFRRYHLVVLDTCDFRVDHVGGWHSGENARPIGRRPIPGEVAPTSPDARGETGIDSFDDGFLNVTENSFRQGKYLYYQRGGDYCKSMSQYLWSLLCALGEAQYLNRTFVMDLELCLSSSDNPPHADQPGKDFRFYFDYEHLRNSLPLMDKKQFFKDWGDWDSQHQNHKIAVREVDYKTTPMELKDDHRTVLTRVFDRPEPNLYWFRVCEGESEKAFQRPWDLVWKSRRINDIVLAICAKMGWEYDAVHVVRGEKVNKKDLWPNLDEDTSPHALIRKLDERLMEGRNVYIATNEQDEHYFDTLRAKWRIFQLDDFKELWANGSEWYKETTQLNGGQPVDFDNYMRVEVDSEVLYKASKRIETFNDLTKDCKNGIGVC